jgi:acyl-CoA synthetase (NDP forming)
MFDLALVLGNQALPGGRRVGIVTNAGGPGILCADVCEAGGLQIPELSSMTRARLTEFLASAASTTNPVDMIASATADNYRQAVTTVLASGEIDSLIVIYISVRPTETDAIVRAVGEGVALARARGAVDRPVLACLMDEQRCGKLELNSESVPTFAFPEAAARALSKVSAYEEWRRRPLGVFADFDDLNWELARKVCHKALANGGPGWLAADDVAAILQAVRLPVLPGGVARTEAGAVEVARRIGFPVAVKLVSRQLIHKSDVGGVHLGLPDAEAVCRAVAEIRERLHKTSQLQALDGFLVQPMVPGGVEVMVGVTQDRLFGPVIAFGLGGIHVEILGDVCFRVTPLTDRDAADMIRSIRGFRLLQGYRGHPAADIEALEELLLRVSRLVEEIPEISELDLNPVFALGPGGGCRIVDARIHVIARDANGR